MSRGDLRVVGVGVLDIVCEKLEEVVSVGETLRALFDYADEGVQGTKVSNVTYQ